MREKQPILRGWTLDLPAIQRDVNRFVERNGLEAPVQARLLDLVSEAGEASKEVLKATDYGRAAFRARAEWAHELGDILFSLVCLANSTGVDLEAALRDALEKYGRRIDAGGEAGSGR